MNRQRRSLPMGICCDHCLGRFFGKRSHGLSKRRTRAAAGRLPSLSCGQPALREVQRGPAGSAGTSSTRCPASGLDRVIERPRRVLKTSTFLVGGRAPRRSWAENEEMVWSDLSLAEPEPFKSEVNLEKSARRCRPCNWKSRGLQETRCRRDPRPRFRCG